MFHVVKQKLYWILIFYYIFWDRVQLSPKASLVQSIVRNTQIYLALYFFTKFTCSQEISFNILARCIVYQLLLKVNVLKKVYIVKPILVKGLYKIARKIIQSFCFSLFMYSVARQKNKTSHFFQQKILIKIYLQTYVWICMKNKYLTYWQTFFSLLFFLCSFIFAKSSFSSLSLDHNSFLCSLSFLAFFIFLSSLFFAAIFRLSSFFLLFCFFLPSLFVFLNLSIFFPFKNFICKNLFLCGNWSWWRPLTFWE